MRRHGEEICLLPPKQRGQHVLGQKYDEMVKMYLRNVRESGGVVLACITIAAARRILLSHDKSALAEFGGNMKFSREWAYSLLRIMHFAKCKVTTAKCKHSPEDLS